MRGGEGGRLIFFGGSQKAPGGVGKFVFPWVCLRDHYEGRFCFEAPVMRQNLLCSPVLGGEGVGDSVLAAVNDFRIFLNVTCWFLLEAVKI